MMITLEFQRKGEIIQHEKVLKTVLKKVDPNAELTIAGSYRRGKPESGDIDVLFLNQKG